MRLINDTSGRFLNAGLKMCIVAVTKQSKCNDEKPSKVLLEACRQKWPTVSFEYLQKALKGDKLPYPGSLPTGI